MRLLFAALKFIHVDTPFKNKFAVLRTAFEQCSTMNKTFFVQSAASSGRIEEADKKYGGFK